MIIKELPELLKASPLAPLFHHLDNSKVIEEGENTTIVHLTLTPIVADDKSLKYFLIVDTGAEVWFDVPIQIIAKDDISALFRVADMNYQLRFGRMYWDKRKNIIGVSWRMHKSGRDDVTFKSIEYIMARLIHVYAVESLYFLKKELSADNKASEETKVILDVAGNVVRDRFLPAIDAVN